MLRNLENRKGRPARLVLGEPLAKEIELLPKPERLHGCMVADEDAVAFSIPRALQISQAGGGGKIPVQKRRI